MDSIINFFTNPSMLFQIIGGTIALLAAISGIFKKDTIENGILTKWGRASLFFLLIGAGISSTSKYYEFKEQSKKQLIEEKYRDSVNHIQDINRVIQLSKLDTSLNKLGSISYKLIQQSKQTQYIAIGMTNSLDKQQELLTGQRFSQMQTLKAYYPLEPVEFSYQKEYPMDQKNIAEYTKRVQRQLVEWLRKEREGRGITSDDLKEETFIINIKNVDSTFLPNYQIEAERYAREMLLTDATTFEFTSDRSKQIVFSSIPDRLSPVFLKLEKKGVIIQDIELFAYFKERVFIKKVTCKNPMRTGKNLLAISSIDLIGRTLTWSSFFTPDAEWHLTEFGTKFKYDYEDFGRTIEINKNDSFLIIKPSHLGLDDIFPDN